MESKKSNRGGKRAGAGRPKGSGSKFPGVECKSAHIPVDIADNIDMFISVFESIADIELRFESELHTSKIDSKTGDFPRTWDKARRLLAELQFEVAKLQSLRYN